jgi:hypothetical protein
MMKYLGSTNGAVMSESAVVRSQIRKNDVVGPGSGWVTPAILFRSWIFCWISVLPVPDREGALLDVGIVELGVERVR